jgi:hypothetical protein
VCVLHTGWKLLVPATTSARVGVATLAISGTGNPPTTKVLDQLTGMITWQTGGSAGSESVPQNMPWPQLDGRVQGAPWLQAHLEGHDP